VGRNQDELQGGLWDVAELCLDPDLVSFVVGKMIERDARAAGIDLDNPIHSIVGLVGSVGMSLCLGSFMGPFGALLGGMIGKVAACGTPMIGDRPVEERDAEEEAWYALRLKALETAIEVTREHTSTEAWNQIADAVQDTISRVVSTHGSEPATLRSAWPVMFNAVSNTMSKRNGNVHRNFLQVYEAACDRLGV
jgi:hypothetical protein